MRSQSCFVYVSPGFSTWPEHLFTILYRFIHSREHGSGKLSLTWPMLRELVTDLQLILQFADCLPWITNNLKPCRSTVASFASSMNTGVGKMCLSLYHCWIQQPRRGEKSKVSVEWITFYTQTQQERLRWIIIGSPAVWDLLTVYLARPKLPSLSSAFITFIATNGWHIKLNLMEDDLTAVGVL